MTRAAMIGCGDVSVVHLEAIAENPDIELVAVCDTDPERLAAATARWKVPGFADHRELVAAVEFDVAHVAVPHFEHARVAVDLLEAGVDVLAEKPMAHTLAEAQRLQAAARSASGRLAICFQNRYNPPVRELRRRLESGELGRITGAFGLVIWHRTPAYYADRPWRATWAGGGGGLLLNQAIHTLDLLQWLVGEVVEVSGNASRRALGDAIEVEDTAEITLTHADGVRSIFFATVGHARDTPVQIEVTTEHAALRLDESLTITHADGRVETVDADDAVAGGRSYWGASHARLIADFHAGHDAGAPFWIGADEGIKTISIIDQVYRQSAIFPS